MQGIVGEDFGALNSILDKTGTGRKVFVAFPYPPWVKFRLTLCISDIPSAGFWETRKELLGGSIVI